MDDLTVIILTLLVVVIGIVGQTKKRRSVQQQPKAENPPRNIWDLLETQMATEPPKIEPEPEFDSDDEIIDVIPKTPVYEFDAKNEGQSMLKDNSDSFVSASEIRKKEKEKFPLRKAVIYSEILKKKYT